ncbi:MAG: hypothetical protein R3F56_00520 [Planctomycetota bacterium]
MPALAPPPFESAQDRYRARRVDPGGERVRWRAAHGLRALLACAGAVLIYVVLQSLLASHALAQSDDLDPYTRHDPVRMRRAGIEALRAFEWAADHTTRDVQSLMGYEPFRFVETAHFELAASLSVQSVPARGVAHDDLRRELAELACVLPGVDPETRVLDGWLRAHLYARRLEQLYAEVEALLGVDAATKGAARPGSAGSATYVGEGPFLGMRGKYRVILCRDSSSVDAYLRNFLDLPAARRSLRVDVDGGAALLLATAESMPDEDLRDDRDLYAAVAYHTAHLLLDGFRHHWHECPPWLEEGLAHWLQLRAVPERACFAARPAELPADPAGKAWSLRVRRRTQSGAVVASAELFAHDDAATLTFADHLAAWSRVDFLVRAHPGAFALFLRTVKGPDVSHLPVKPTWAVVRARQHEALRKVFGWTTEDFDTAWRGWVLDRYPAGT